MTEHIRNSLETCADQDIDISEDFYRRFFESDRGAAELMSHCDTHMKGRMLHEVLELLLGDTEDYLRWEVGNHLTSYQVDFGMYTTMFEALLQSVQQALGDRWTPDMESQWRQRIDGLLEQIGAVASATDQ